MGGTTSQAKPHRTNNPPKPQAKRLSHLFCVKRLTVMARIFSARAQRSMSDLKKLKKEGRKPGHLTQSPTTGLDGDHKDHAVRACQAGEHKSHQAGSQ
jgi:hypothetical protein